MRVDQRKIRDDDICFVKGEVPIPIDRNEMTLFKTIKSDKSALKKLVKRTKLSLSRWSLGFTSQDFYDQYPAHRDIDKDVEEDLIRHIARRLWLKETSQGVFEK